MPLVAYHLRGRPKPFRWRTSALFLMGVCATGGGCNSTRFYLMCDVLRPPNQAATFAICTCRSSLPKFRAGTFLIVSLKHLESCPHLDSPETPIASTNGVFDVATSLRQPSLSNGPRYGRWMRCSKDVGGYPDAQACRRRAALRTRARMKASLLPKGSALSATGVCSSRAVPWRPIMECNMLRLLIYGICAKHSSVRFRSPQD